MIDKKETTSNIQTQPTTQGIHTTNQKQTSFLLLFFRYIMHKL